MSVDWGLELDEETVDDWNITYNLTNMLNVAYGIGTDDRAVFLQVFDRQITCYYDLWEHKTGGELIEGLEQAITRMEADPAKYKAYNAPNGWGMYDDALRVLRDFLEACKRYPAATVWVSR